MRLKYFIRGLGTGVLSSTIILTIVFALNSPKELTDAQILEKAKQLEQPSSENSLDFNKQLEKNNKSNKNSKKSEKINKQASSESTTSNQSEKTKPEQTPTVEASVSNKDDVVINVKEGETVREICDELCDKGVVKNSESMRRFMIEKGYDSLLHAGSFTVKKGMSADSIGKTLAQ